MKKVKKIKAYMPLYIIMLPGILLLLMFNYAPMFGLFIAFKNINYTEGLFRSPWANPIFKNFEFLFATEDSLIFVRNTIMYNMVFMITGTVVAVAFAILLNYMLNKRGSKVYQTILYLPSILSMVVVSYLVLGFLGQDSGFINKYVLPALGMEPVQWYTKPQYWYFILPLVNLWKGVGGGTVIYLATIIGIEKDMYEAASIDGASKFRQIFSITLPKLKPTIIILNIMAVGKIFYADFGLFYSVPLNVGALYPATQVVDTYVYRGLMSTGNIGMSSAAAFFQSIMGFVLVFLTNTIVKKIDPDSAMF